MATNTSILGLSKPAYTDDADVAVINSNSDLLDAEAGRTRANFAAEYSTSSAYAVGAFCTHAGILYQCNTAIGSGGEAWTAAHWTQISAGDAIVTNSQAIATLNSNLGKLQGNYIPSTDDLNNYYGTEHTGLYNVAGTAPANCPDTWVQLAVIASSSGVVQIILHENFIRIRRRTGSPLTWTDWRTVNVRITPWTTVQKDGDNSYFRYRCNRNTVDVEILHKVSSASISAWSNYLIGTLPSDFKPNRSVEVRAITDRASSAGVAALVNADGQVFIRGLYSGATDSSDIIQAHISYPID